MLTAIKPKSRQITDAERTEDGVVFRSEFEMLRVQVKTPEIVRITATPCEHFSKKERPGTVCDRVSDEYSIGEDCGEYILTTNAVTVYVDKASGAIRFNDPDVFFDASSVFFSFPSHLKLSVKWNVSSESLFT